MAQQSIERSDQDECRYNSSAVSSYIIKKAITCMCTEEIEDMVHIITSNTFKKYIYIFFFSLSHKSEILIFVHCTLTKMSPPHILFVGILLKKKLTANSDN